MFVEEFKYAVKEKKMPECITDDIEISSDDADTEDSDRFPMKKIMIKKILMKKTKYRMLPFLYLKHLE